jgi:copper transport protein
MAGAGLSLAVSSHAASASPEWVTGPAVFVHGVAVAFWVGALAPLIALARKRDGTVLSVLLRFSRIAVPVVAVLALTGIGLAIVQLESFGALIGTRYGIILLVKLTLVAILLGLAALSRYVVTPALKAEPRNSRELKGGVFFEYVAVLLILGVVAGWRFAAPPRTLAAAAQAAVEAPLAIHIHTETAMFQVLISPGKMGSDDFVLQLMAGDASPLPAKEATLTLSLPERGVEPVERSATLGSDGYWHLRAVPLPLPGRWHMRIDALVTDFEKVTLEDDFEVR